MTKKTPDELWRKRLEAEVIQAKDTTEAISRELQEVNKRCMLLENKLSFALKEVMRPPEDFNHQRLRKILEHGSLISIDD